MIDTFKFPNGGYEINICRKDDIVQAAFDNITDREIALEIIDRCEKDAVQFLAQGKWISIPYIGNIRVPKNKQLIQSDEQQLLIQEAKETLDHDRYVLFKKDLQFNNKITIKANRYFNYIVSIAVGKNRKLYKSLCADKGEHYAKIYMYSISNIVSTDNEYEILNND